MAGDNCRNGRSNWTMTQGDHGVCCDWFCGRLINRPATQEAPRGWRIPSRDTPQQGTRNQFCSFLLVHRFVRRLAMVTWTFHEPGTTQKKKRMNLKNHFPIKFRFAGFHFLRHPRTWNVEISGHLKNDFYSSKILEHTVQLTNAKFLTFRKIQISPLKSNTFF